MHKSYIKNSLILNMIHDYDNKDKKQNEKEMLFAFCKYFRDSITL